MFKGDYVLIVDLEATCWKNDRAPEGQQIDIIEIGICKLYVDFGEIREKRSFYVIPERSEITPFCEELTGITDQLIQRKGMSFARACKKITQLYAPKNRAWFSYGKFDEIQLKQQCEDLNVPYPMGENHYNLLPLVALRKKLRRGTGMKRALRLFDLPFEGKHHSGADDAYNAAQLVRELITVR